MVESAHPSCHDMHLLFSHIFTTTQSEEGQIISSSVLWFVIPDYLVLNNCTFKDLMARILTKHTSLFASHDVDKMQFIHSTLNSCIEI